MDNIGIQTILIIDACSASFQ